MPTPADRTATLRGLRFHWLDWGTAGAAPLLMLHGAAQTAHSFDEVAPALTRHHHVVAADQRGHGDTAWAARYHREDFVGDVGALLDAQGWPDAALVAMSLGGLNALAFAARHPERVRALVLVDVVPHVAPAGVSAVAQQLARRDFDSFDDAVAHARAFNARRSEANIRERLGHAMRPLPDGRWTYKFDPAMAAGARDPGALWAAVRRLRCPVLLVRGTESAMVTDDGIARFRDEAPHARVAAVAGAGHSVMGDAPEGFLAAVSPFLARHAR